LLSIFVNIVPQRELYFRCGQDSTRPVPHATRSQPHPFHVFINSKQGGVMNSIVVNLATTAGLMIAGSALAVEMPPLAKELNCTACHAIDHKVVGPAWRDVANRYTGRGVKTYKYSNKGSAAPDAKEYPLIEGLVIKVSKGGSGNWGAMPMPANDLTGTKRDKIRQLVEFEQSLANTK
jgi:cytochrome c